MQSPWTRDGKVRAELVNITPEVSGKIIKVNISDNQQVKQGDLLFALDPTPFEIALSNANAAIAKAESDLAKANHEATRRGQKPTQDNGVTRCAMPLRCVWRSGSLFY